ncbi:MAG: hypothetical protein HUU03_04905 [Planctomycetaceae bacterium]|nr:hypothetical protein [Planctomycetota bacterium]NUO15763.1 hypothetical protein [Planctomycetaceae bacterium]GIK53267.1 MAG: hypothetical protein BroJett014_22400 [Planctomycetota bacterium]
MIAELQRKAVPFLAGGLLLQVGGSFLRFMSIELFVALAAVGAALLIVGCMHYARARGYKRELGLLGLLSVLGVVILVLLPDREKSSPEGAAELPAQTTEAFKDDPDVKDALESINAMGFSAARREVDVDDSDTDDLDTGPDELELSAGGGPVARPAAKPRGQVPMKVATSSSQAAREALVGQAGGEIVPSRLLYQAGGKLTFTCHCGKRYKVDVSRAGELLTCRYCKKNLLVPVPELKA